MENASKALIIAAAVLLSILIIALGMQIYNSASSSMSNADLSSQEIQSFNSTFETYQGAQKGTTIRNMLTAVVASNEANPDRKITVNGEDASGLYGKVTSNISYYVTLEYASSGDNTGIITNIKVVEGKSASGNKSLSNKAS